MTAFYVPGYTTSSWEWRAAQHHCCMLSFRTPKIHTPGKLLFSPILPVHFQTLFPQMFSSNTTFPEPIKTAVPLSQLPAALLKEMSKTGHSTPTKTPISTIWRGELSLYPCYHYSLKHNG